MVRCRPAPNRAAAGLELVERRGVDAGLGMNDTRGGMEPRPFDGGRSRQALVEDARDNAEQSGAQASATRRATGKRKALLVECQ